MKYLKLIGILIICTKIIPNQVLSIQATSIYASTVITQNIITHKYLNIQSKTVQSYVDFPNIQSSFKQSNIQLRNIKSLNINPSFYINFRIDTNIYSLSFHDFVYGMNDYVSKYSNSEFIYFISNRRLEDIRYQYINGDINYRLYEGDGYPLTLKYLYANMIYKKAMNMKEKKFTLTYSKNYVYQFVKENLYSYNKEPINGKIYVESETGYIQIQEGQIGRTINMKEIMRTIDKKLSDWNFGNVDIVVETTDIVPTITKKKLEECKDILGSATSVYNSNSNKYHNIKNGVNKLQGIVIVPNQSISINEILSPYTNENGYIISSVFTKEEILYGVGGGVCQLTSTIYESLMKAELAILERHPHNYLVSYSKPTIDSTVSTHGLDLRFQNNTKNPIFIAITLTEDELAVKIYGKEYRNSNRTIDLRVVIEKNYIPSSGRQGCIATLYKDVYWKNKKIEERYIYQDHYMEYEESL